MEPLEKAINVLVQFMYQVAGASIVVMMLLTCADVILRFATTLRARYGWEALASLKPIPGTYELVKAQAVFEIVTGTLGLLFFGIIGYQSIHYAINARSLGEVSMTLRLPYYPFIYGISLSAFTVSVILLLGVIKSWKKVSKT
jgi:TRAP-type C4-dicarboxylate transport system permease small subunit